MSKNAQRFKWEPQRVSSYFKAEALTLSIVTVTGIVYNVGMIAGPYFEGQLAQRLYDVMAHRKTAADMLSLALCYLAVILLVQSARCVKRFYVRRFANDTARNMREMIYNSLVHKTKKELEEEKVGALMTKAVADVDACCEGMRKFTTELFDTGVVLAAYLGMLFYYDWRLALLSGMFTPLAYLAAGKLKTVVTGYSAAYKKSAETLNSDTLSRVENALTYRVYGREEERGAHYEQLLCDYEKRAVYANLWENTMQPLYNVVSMAGVLFVLYFGSKNLLGTGWTSWNIAAFTTFLSCFTKMALKSSKAAKLFNAVQKAQVSWRRIKPLMRPYIEPQKKLPPAGGEPVRAKGLSVGYGEEPVLQRLCFTVMPGEIVGVTGTVATGKSTLGKAFLGEELYSGSLRIGEEEVSKLPPEERSRLVSYMGHQPELISGTIAENICLGVPGPVEQVLRDVCFWDEVAEFPEKENTPIGGDGMRLSGGQQARLALARTLYHAGSVLVLDDPFSALDARTEARLLQSLRSAAKEKAVLLISHRIDLFGQLDGVLFLEGGQGKFAPHKELILQNENYRRLYAAQAKGETDEELAGAFDR